MIAMRLRFVAQIICGFSTLVMTAGKPPAGKGKANAVATVGGSDAWEEKKNEDGRVVQQLKIEAPTMTEEDQHGYVMPDRYRCDACRAVMFHVDAALRQKQPKSRRMKEWEFMDVLEDTCQNGFDGYGVKLVNGENVLSGPGLKQSDNLAPGEGAIQMGGETWSKRLGEICRKIVFEKVGEDEIYNRFHTAFRKADADGKGLSEGFCASSEIRDCSMGPKPPMAPKGQATNAREKKKTNDKKSQARSERVSASAQALDTRKSDAKIEAGEDRIDVQNFLKLLASKHGVPSTEYTTPRSRREWEKLLVSVTGKIFSEREEITV